MDRQEIGRFHAITFDESSIEFIAFDDNTIDCPILDINSIKMIELKPRFKLFCGDKIYKYDVTPFNYGINPKLIGKYDIDKELFDYLKQNRMIKYSQDMAYLYDFEDKKGYDSEKRYYGVPSPYKWAKKKGPILSKQKKGYFN